MRKSVPVEWVAEQMGKSPLFVRKGIEQGTLPIGCYVKGNKRNNYYINPKLLEQVTGLRWEGEADG